MALTQGGGLLNTIGQIGSSLTGGQGGTLNNILGTIGNLLTGGQGGTSNSLLQNLIGGGLTAGGLLTKEEPGYLTEARQAAREFAVNPLAMPNTIGQTLGALEPQLAPIFQNQLRQGTDILTQQIKNAFPATAGFQGATTAGVSDLLGRQMIPEQQQQMFNLATQLLGNQQQAQRDIMQFSQPDQLGQLLTMMGLNMLGGGGQNQTVNIGGLGGQTGQTGQGDLLSGIGNLLSGNTGGLSNQILNALSAANVGGNVGQLVSLLTSGALAGQPFPYAVDASTAAGQVIQQAINAGLVESPAAVSTGAGGVGAGAAGGLTGDSAFALQGLSGVAGAIGSGAAGYFVGGKIGEQFEGGAGTSGTRAKGALSGAAGGAAAGAAIGSIVPGIGTAVGAIIGAIAGGIGGAKGSGEAEGERKEVQIEQETAATAAQRPAALQMFGQGADLGRNIISQIDQMNSMLPGAVTEHGITYSALDQMVNEAIRTNPQAKAIFDEAFNESILNDVVNTETGQVIMSRGAALDNQFKQRWVTGLRNLISSRVGTLSDPNSEIVKQLQSSEMGWFQPSKDQGAGLSQHINVAADLLDRMLKVIGVS